MTAIAYSQTTARAEKSLNDPKRAENSAKADVYMQKHRISDSAQPTVNPEPKTGTKRKRINKRSSNQ